MWVSSIAVKPAAASRRALGPGAGVALIDQLLEAAEEGEEAGLVPDPVGDAEREHDVRAEGSELGLPVGIGVEIDPPELRLRVERERRHGGRLEDLGIAVDRQRGGRARLPEHEDREQGLVAAELEHPFAAVVADRFQRCQRTAQGRSPGKVRPATASS